MVARVAYEAEGGAKVVCQLISSRKKLIRSVEEVVMYSLDEGGERIYPLTVEEGGEKIENGFALVIYPSEVDKLERRMSILF